MSSRTPKVTASLLARRARALHRYLPAAIAGDDAGVHQARVASRRLREAVPVLTNGLKHSGKACRKIRRLTRALGTVRELDVSLHLLDELSASDELSRPALQDVRLHVIEERDRRREAMLGRLAHVKTDKLERRLKSVTEAVELDDSQHWRQALGTRLVKRAKRLAAAIDNAGQLYAPERLHRVRLATKKLRYGLELAADSGISAAAPHVRSLKRAQELLGRLNDLQVLQTHVAAVQAAPVGRSVPHQGLAAIAGRIEEECRRLHGRYIAQAEALCELAEKVPSQVVPRLARRTRPLKMGLQRPRKGAARGVPRRSVIAKAGTP
jgi:CHAD domain-containing protein